jgi:hypothetical protein
MTPPLVAAAAAIVIGGAGIWFVARDSIMIRVRKTQEQVADMRANGGIGDRATLYRDTWRMARAKLWFGWGMGSYPHVFTFFNTKVSRADRLPVFFRMRTTTGSKRSRSMASSDPRYSDCARSFRCGACGCGRFPARCQPISLPAVALILAYAWLEFPFGKPGRGLLAGGSAFSARFTMYGCPNPIIHWIRDSR